MKRKREITTADLNKALREVSRDARRENKALGLETVMSHPGKIDFLKYAKGKGYKTYLYFIATDDPSINISRIKNRVRKGGHGVPEEKIKTRYDRSLDLLYNALETADRAYILDSSGRRRSVIFEKKSDGKGYPQIDSYPLWFEKSVIGKMHSGNE